MIFSTSLQEKRMVDFLLLLFRRNGSFLRVRLRKNEGSANSKRKNTLYERYVRVKEPVFVLFALLSMIRDVCVIFKDTRPTCNLVPETIPCQERNVFRFSFHRRLQTSCLCLPLFITYIEKKIARDFLPFDGVLLTFTWYTRTFRTYTRFSVCIYNMTFLAKRTRQ